MSYTITISEVLNNIAIDTEPYTVSISEVVNNVAVSMPAANAIAITNATYPVTVSYNATVFSGGGGGGLNNIVEDASPQLGADLDVNGFAISSAGNADVNITPNGTGNVNLNADTIRLGELNQSVQLTNYGVGNFNISNSSGNGSLILDSDGGFSWTSGSGSSEVVFAMGGTTGAVSVVSGIGGFTLTDGQAGIYLPGSANGNIQISAGGSGDIVLGADTVFVGDNNVQARITTTGTGNLLLNTNSGTNSGSITIAQGANANITLQPNGTGDVVLSSDTVVVGDINANATVTSNGTGNLILNTNSGSNSGSITIAQGVNGAITLQPNGTGKLWLKNAYWPTADGTSNQVLKTDGAGQTSWTSISSLVSDVNTTYNISAETVAGGANLRLTSSDSTTDDVKIAGGTNVTVTRTDANTITINAESGTYTFLSESNPSSPDLGDHWFNPANQVLQIYTESGWLTVSADDLYF